MTVKVNCQERPFGLALSGGGFRASLFHLGVLRRLHELGLHKHIDYISAVSGGSIVAAPYCLLKPKSSAEFVEFEKCILRGIKSNPRLRWLGYWTLILAPILGVSVAGSYGLHRAVGLLGLHSWLIMFACFVLVVITPFWRRIHPMAWVFERCFDLRGRPLSCTASQAGFPTLIMNATSLASGMRWVFSSAFVGEDSGASGEDVDKILKVSYGPACSLDDRAHDVKLSVAMLASACFPPAFHPVDVTLPRKNVLTQTEAVSLVDGGVYDNQGFRIFLRWLRAASPESRVDYLLVSDAAQPMSENLGRLSRIPLIGNFCALFRSALIQGKADRDEAYDLLFPQVSTASPGLRQFALFFIGGNAVPSGRSGRQSFGFPANFGPVLSEIRTDFDRFSDLEIRVLMYHGYSLVNHRIINYCFDILKQDKSELVTAILTKEPYAPNHEFPFDWSDLDLTRIPSTEALPAMDDWATFNRKLSSELSTVFATANRWKQFLEIVDFADPRQAHVIDKALRYLSRSSRRLGICRHLYRAWDCIGTR